MAEYIEREKAVQTAIEACIEVCKDITGHGITHIHGVEIAEKIESIPAADVVEVIRCKDCIHGQWDNYYGHRRGGLLANIVKIRSCHLTIFVPTAKGERKNDTTGSY